MTKTDLQQLQFTGNIFDLLIRDDSENESKPLAYRKALIEAQDHYSMLLTVIDNHKAEVLNHNFWNDELAQWVLDEQIKKGIHYVARLMQETSGEWTLNLEAQLNESNQDEEFDEDFEGYTIDDDAAADVNLLHSMGYNIIFKK